MKPDPSAPPALPLLLVTVTEVESRAVLAAFARHTGQPARQKLAAANSAEFVLHTLQTVPLRRSSSATGEAGDDTQALQAGAGGSAQGDKNVVAGERGLAVGGDFHGNVTIN